MQFDYAQAIIQNSLSSAGLTGLFLQAQVLHHRWALL